MQNVDARYGLPISPEVTGNFFRGMSLGDFYGKNRPNPRKIPITTEQFFRWSGTSPNDEERRIRQHEKMAFARTHGIEEIGGMQSHKDTGSFLLERTSYQNITEWLPHHEERQLILHLAQSVTGEAIKPLILDAGCGSGVATKMLAEDGSATTIGVDLLLDKRAADRLPPVKGAELCNVDLWDVLDEFFPQFPSSVQRERQELLKRLRERIQRDPVFQHLSVFSASGQFGEPEALNEEVARLQELTQQRTAESPVDLVICSFMPSTAELTIPIRDGIHPKAIVYIRPKNGMSGAGDYYITEEEAMHPDEMPFTFINRKNDIEPASINHNTIISYNPGIHYRTVARWDTPWRNNWMGWANRFGYVFDAEATIQLRNDVQLRPVEPPHVEKYSLDIQLENGFSEPSESRQFLSGIQQANQLIFNS